MFGRMSKLQFSMSHLFCALTGISVIPPELNAAVVLVCRVRPAVCPSRGLETSDEQVSSCVVHTDVSVQLCCVRGDDD